MKKTLQTFDEKAFKAKFRAAALMRGIDPNGGATSYQAALVQAEQRRATIVGAADYGWWRGRSIFSEQDEGGGANDSALANVRIVRTDADRLDEDGLVPFSRQSIDELWREVRREVVEDESLALRTLHDHQRSWEQLRQRRVTDHHYSVPYNDSLLTRV